MAASLSALLSALLLLFPIAAAASTTAEVVVRPPTRIIVDGAGIVTLPPDEAIVEAVVETNAGAASTSIAENNEVYQKVVDALVAIGIARSDVTLSGYQVTYVARPASAPPSLYQRYGYTVSRRFQISTHNLSLAGKIVDAATSAGATSIEGVSFGLSDTSVVERVALRLAVLDATEKARELATDAHLRIAGILTVTLGASGSQPLRVIAHVAAAPVTTFDNGNTTVSQTVNVVFLAKP